MREMPIAALADAMAGHPAPELKVECLRGHFFKLDLFSICGDCADANPVGGALHFGSERIALDSEHACQLADRVRTAIDNSVAGAIIHRPACRDGGH